MVFLGEWLLKEKNYSGSFLRSRGNEEQVSMLLLWLFNNVPAMDHVTGIKRQLKELHQCLLLVHTHIAYGFSGKNWEEDKVRLYGETTLGMPLK